jgi:hypothetical protein
MKTISIICFIAILSFGCKDSITDPPNSAQVSLMVMNQARPRAMALNESVSAYLAGIDSIMITRTRLLINSIDFDGGDDESDSDDMEFSTKPMVVTFGAMDTVAVVAVANVPFGSYDEVDIEIYPLKFAYLDTLAPADSIALADFAKYGYSIIVDGVVYKNGNATPFTFSSAVYVEQEYEFDPPLTVSADNPTANITLMIYSMNWFRDYDYGLLDPSNPENKYSIAQNIHNSFWMFEDDDGDGEDDGDD